LRGVAVGEGCILSVWGEGAGSAWAWRFAAVCVMHSGVVVDAVQDTMRYAIMDNLQRFTEYILVATEGIVTVVSTNEVKVDYSASHIDMRHRRPSLFAVDVEIVPDTSGAATGVVSPQASVVLDTQSVDLGEVRAGAM
jgi:hypothetical protein